MPDSKSMFDNIVKHYVASRLNSKENNLSDSEKIGIEKAVRSEVLKGAYEILSGSLRNKAREEADKEKRKIIRKFKITLIIETLFIAFLVGIIVNQVTAFIPARPIAGVTAIVVSLLLCVIVITFFLNVERD